MKRALLIGINYIGQEAELNGCINDVVDVKQLCVELNYDDIILLHDNLTEKPETRCVTKASLPFALYPNKKNMLSALNWIVSQSNKGDTILVHYSGHGTQDIASSREEADRYDEALVPVDYSLNGIIIDNELRNVLVEPCTKKGIKLRCIFDSCHSGTCLDLKYNLKLATRDLKCLRGQRDSYPDPDDVTIRALVREQVKRELSRYLDNDLVEKYMTDKENTTFIETDVDSGAENEIKLIDLYDRRYRIKCDILLLSGCNDDQTSADASFNNRANGALTKMFLNLYNGYVKNKYVPSIITFLRDIRTEIKENRFTQVPQISADQPFSSLMKFDI